jgi:hypothetical protein
MKAQQFHAAGSFQYHGTRQLDVLFVPVHQMIVIYFSEIILIRNHHPFNYYLQRNQY